MSNTRTTAPAVARALVAANADVLSLTESRHTLEDVYLELTTAQTEEAKAPGDDAPPPLAGSRRGRRR